MNITSKRDVSRDIAKGIGIILVVFGHTFPIYSVTSYVYSFHMPLFFFLAGYTFNHQKYLKNPWGFFIGYTLRFMAPYFVAAICSYILYVYVAPIISLPEVSAGSAALGILKGNGNNLVFNNVLWFLPAFFCGGLIFLGLMSMLKGIRLFIGAVIISFAGIMIGLSHPLPFGLDIAMTTQFFIYCGHLFREADWAEKIRTSGAGGIPFYIFLVATIAMLAFSSMNGRIDMMSRVYGQPVLFFIAGLSGSVAALFTSLFLSMDAGYYHYIGRILETTGRASMYIFISHIPIFHCIASAFALIWGFWIYDTFNSFWYLLFIIGVSFPALMYMLVAFLTKKNH